MTHVHDILRGIDQSTFSNDEPARLLALQEARALVNRLSKPHEIVESLIWLNPFTLLACKISSDMGLFQSLSTTAQTAAQIASKAGTDAVLTHRLLRMLLTNGVVSASSADTFIENEISAAFKLKDGAISGIDHFWPIGAQKLAKLPEYFKRADYRNPSDTSSTPFSQMMDCPSFWAFLKAHPEHRATFNSMMSSLRKGQAPWTELYDVDRLYANYDTSNAFCVDVGGGTGRDMTYLGQALPGLQPDSIVLQDLSSVIEQANTAQLPAVIMTMHHNFFDAQPIKHARVYFLHSICHDWPDAESEQILTKVQEAMKPGYSKVLLYETVLPSSNAELTARMAAMDLNMMCHFAALERTEVQWRSLLAAAGLKWISLSVRPGSHQGIIEAECI